MEHYISKRNWLRIELTPEGPKLSSSRWSWLKGPRLACSRVAWISKISCPNEDCELFGKSRYGNIVKLANYGRSRWRCKMCKSQFEYNLGTGETQDLKPGSSWPYCPNASCLDHNKSNKGNIIKASNYGKNKKKLRWKCKTCGKTFSDTHSSKVYRKKLSPRKIYRIVQMRSKKHSIREIASRLKINKNTVQHYLKEYEKGDHYGQATIA